MEHSIVLYNPVLSFNVVEKKTLIEVSFHQALSITDSLPIGQKTKHKKKRREGEGALVHPVKEILSPTNS